MAYSAIQLNIRDRVARITLDRPESGNTIDLSMAQEIIDACKLIEHDDEIRVVTIAGTGRDFCRGNEYEQSGNKRKPAPGDIWPVAATIASLEIPVLCAIHGKVYGQGLEIALACDVRMAAINTRCGFPGIAMGMLPVDGGTQRLPRIIGKAMALEMIFNAQTIDAAGALEIGLVSAVRHKKALISEIEEMAQGIAQKAPFAFRYIKEAVNQGLDMTLEQGLRLEADLYFLLHTTTDRTEGIKAFQQKRKPQFEGK